MTNIWADSYKEIRKPFFDTESLEEERVKKDYDGDGKIESGAKEYRGAVHNAIQKKRGGKPDGQDTSSVKEEVEEVESVDEGMTLQDYKKKRSALKQKEKRASDKIAPTRRAGIHTPDHAPERAARHRANVDPDFEGNDERNYPGGKLNPKKVRKARALGELGEEMKPLPRTKMFRKAGNLGRDIVSPATGEKDRQKKYDRSKKIISQLNKEEAETITEVDSCSTSKKVDVMKGGKKNKVTINPPIREEVEAWIGELVEEGYDISEFTMDEMIEIYESVALEEQMPATGDAQTVTTSDSAQLSAKRRMAQAQIRADLARVQFQKASMTKESVDSIVEYLSQRADAFENLEEGVFDPKKSKLRPASERSQRVMTDAQRTADKKAAARTAEIHSKGETVLQGLRPQGKRGKVKTTPDAKPAAPAANRTVRGRYDKLAAAANKVLKSTQKDK